MKNYMLEKDPVLNALIGLRSSVGSERNTVTLDSAINSLGDYITGRITPNSKIVILNISSGNRALSNYIIDMFSAYIVNESTLVVVDRRNLELLQQEMDFQLSGEVGEDTAQAVGKKLGAQSIISGKIEPLGDIYRLQIQVIEVETAKMQGMQSKIIKRDVVIGSMTGDQRNTRYAGEDWKYKFFHAGIRPGFSLHFYDTANTQFNGIEPETAYSVDAAVQIALQAAQYVSFQAEFVFTADSMNISRSLRAFDEYENFLYNYDTTQKFTSQNALIPILVKGTWRPSVFSIEGLAGIYFAVPIGQMKITDSFYGRTETVHYAPSTGFAAGGNFGVNFGPGLLFLDIRYMADFDVTNDAYRRSMVSFGIGYEIGFFTTGR
jgi:hypothetical protein